MDNNELIQAWLDEPKHLKHILLGIDDLNTLDKNTLIEIIKTFIQSDAIEYKTLTKRGAPPKKLGENIYPIFACVVKAKVTGKSFKITWQNYETKDVPKKPKLAPLTDKERKELSLKKQKYLKKERLYQLALKNLTNAFFNDDQSAKRAVNTFELKSFMSNQKVKT